MSDYQSVAPTMDPVSLSDVKAHLNVSHNDDDSLLTSYLKAATNFVEQRTNRCFVHQTRVCKMRTFADTRYVHGRRIYLPRSPLSSVTSISYIASDGTTTTLPSSDYIVSTGDKPGRISEAYNATWPDTRVYDDNVTITYVVGHSSSSTGVPPQAALAIEQLVAHWYRTREPVAQAAMQPVPLTIEALLESEMIEQYG